MSSEVVSPVARSIMERVVKKTTKKAGEDSLMLYSDDDERFGAQYFISTGAPDLDQKLGGGIAGGRICEVFSNNESEGKSTFAATVARECQKMGGAAVYLDSENTALPSYFRQFGLDVTNGFAFSFCPSLESAFTTMEEFAVNLRKEIDPSLPILFVLDSVAAAMTESQEEGDYAKPGVATQARVLSSSLRKFKGILTQTRSTLLLVNQSRTKIGVQYGDPNDTPGGRAMKFYASQRIALRRCSKLTSDGTKNGKLLGIEVEAHIVKNKISPPWKKSKFRLLFYKGIEWDDSAFALLTSKGAITGGAAGRYRHVATGESLTRREFPALLAAHPEIREEVARLVATPDPMEVIEADVDPAAVVDDGAGEES